MTECTYVTDDSSSIIVDTKPKVTMPVALEFREGDKVVGTVKATYNFSKLPQGLHAFALDMVSRKQVVYLNL